MATDPTSGAAALTVSGALGVFLADVGLPPPLLFVSFMGACFGLLFSKPGKGWWHDMLVFACVAIGGAQIGVSFGPLLAEHYPKITNPEKVVTLFTSILFHPIFNALAGRLPDIFGARLGGQRTPGEGAQND